MTINIWHMILWLLCINQLCAENYGRDEVQRWKMMRRPIIRKQTYNTSVSAFYRLLFGRQWKISNRWKPPYGMDQDILKEKKLLRRHTPNLHMPLAIYFWYSPKNLKEKAGKHLVQLIAGIIDYLPSSGIYGESDKLYLHYLHRPFLISVSGVFCWNKEYPSWGFSNQERELQLFGNAGTSYTPEKGLMGNMKRWNELVQPFTLLGPVLNILFWPI